MALEDVLGAGAVGAVLYILFLLALPILLLWALWRIGTALHRVADGIRAAVHAEWPDTRPLAGGPVVPGVPDDETM